MKNETKLVNKVKRLLRRLGCPRWLHHFGPKKYEFLHHLCALLTRHFCRLSYRRIKHLFDLLGFVCPSKSALQYTSAKLNSNFWQRVLKITSGQAYLVAIDSTGFSRTGPSYHYLKRINGALPKIPVKLSVAFDTRKKKFCSAKIRVLPAHDSKDAKFLLQQTKHEIAVADKAYNSEKLFQLASEQGTTLMVPEKSNAKRGFFRKKMQEKFRIRTYHRRELVESGNSSIKRKFGSSVSSKKARTIRSELYGRLACHNILSCFLRLLGQSP
jgi:hypothetical protein